MTGFIKMPWRKHGKTTLRGLVKRGENGNIDNSKSGRNCRKK
jgi:hypothetical protein